MRLIFAGTPAFAAAGLQALIDIGYDIQMVLTQPDRPAGRGMKPAPSPVKLLAERHALPLAQPLTLKTSEIQGQLKQLAADVIVVAAYGLILPQAVLDMPRRGCFNIHASLLPRWRGAAPIQRALLAGDRETGITIMQMDAGLDTGPMLLQERIPIMDMDTAQTLHDKLAALGAKCIIQALRLLERGALTTVPQNQDGACYAPKIEKTEAEIEWRQSAVQIARAVRAFNPFPGAFSFVRGTQIKIWRTGPVAHVGGDPGEIVEIRRDGILVACGVDGLWIEVLQRPGGKKLAAGDFLSGFPLVPGDRFGA